MFIMFKHNFKFMTSRILTVIGCPILEDELIYSIMNDEEEKDIRIVKTEPSKSLVRKLDRNKIPYDVIDEDEILEKGITDSDYEFSIIIKMLDMALHRKPKELRERIEEETIRFSKLSGAIALYYGMCGNYGWDVTKWAEEKGLCPVIVFRDRKGNVCDDCVAVAVGGTDKYRKLLKAHTGHMYFTPGVAVNWNDFMEAGVPSEGGWKNNKESLKWFFEQVNYDSVLQIDTGLGDYEEMRESVKEFADTYDFKIIEADDRWPDLYPAEKLYKDAKKALSR